MRLLGIDFGLKKIGLALAERLLAKPLMVIRNTPAATKRIRAVCQQYGVEKIVIGKPDSGISRSVDQFAGRLNQDTHLPVEYEVETLTSKEAIVKMVEAGKRKKFRQEMEDAAAAALILENYLEKIHV